MENQHLSSKQKIFNLIILDESGSMGSIKRDIIRGFNEVVQTIQSVAKEFPDQEHRISLFTFNSKGTKLLLDNESVDLLTKIDDTLYRPDESTPLYDAMGIAINHQRNLIQSVDNPHVLVTILTDGEENASKEFEGAQIKAMVEELKEKQWTFTYIGANHDVNVFAERLSISNSLAFAADEEGVKEMFTQDMHARRMYSYKIAMNESSVDDYFSLLDNQKNDDNKTKS
jgi:Mg-chelatase subunit ChlD